MLMSGLSTWQMMKLVSEGFIQVYIFFKWLLNLFSIFLRMHKEFKLPSGQGHGEEESE